MNLIVIGGLAIVLVICVCIIGWNIRKVQESADLVMIRASILKDEVASMELDLREIRTQIKDLSSSLYEIRANEDDLK